MPCFNAGRRGGFDEPVTKGRQVTRGRRLRLRVFRVIVLVLGGAFFLLPIGAMFEFSRGGNHVGAPRTLEAWTTIVTYPDLVGAIRDSLGLAAITSVAMVVLLLPTMIWVRLRLPRLKRTIEFLCLLPLTIPAIVLVVGLSPVYRWMAINLVDTIFLLSFAYVVLVLPFAYRALDAGLSAIDVKTLSEAARSLGAGWGTVMFRVIAPNMSSALLNACLLSVALVLGEFTFANLLRSYVGVSALDGLSLTLAPGELVALLGPSGCGKTTALRLVAGLEQADSGRVIVGGEDVTGQPTNKRDVGMVFQAYSLFPHMTAWQNVAFGLQMRKVDARRRRQRAGEMLELVGLSGFADRFAHQLSGGQQQRVALARALAIQPKVLLLDEPLSALDAKVRARLRDEIRRVQLEVGITTLFVTHDQEEALAIADRVGVMQSGRLEQLGPPTTIYSRPATPFVAEFVGLTNRLAGGVRGGDVEVRGTRLPLVQPDAADGPAVALVRPEAVTFGNGEDTGPGPLVGTVIATVFLGATSRVTVDLGDVTILAQLPTSEASAHPAGTRVRLALRPDPVPIARDEAAVGRA